MVEPHEELLAIACHGDVLTGVLADGGSTGDIGVLIIVGGPQYRVGSHRGFVLLARRLAAGGYPCLRFDVRGMGDSGGQLRSFEHIGDDIEAAIAALLKARPSLRRIILWGLCDGASAALLKLRDAPDPRVAGLCLVNPWVRSDAGLARTRLRHYYLQRLLQREFWRKLFDGRVSWVAARDFMQGLRDASLRRSRPAQAASFQDRMAEGLKRCRGPVLFLLSSDDFTAKEFTSYTASDATWRTVLSRPAMELRDLPGADHTCSAPASQRLLEDETLAWLDRMRHATTAR